MLKFKNKKSKIVDKRQVHCLSIIIAITIDTRSNILEHSRTRSQIQIVNNRQTNRTLIVANYGEIA